MRAAKLIRLLLHFRWGRTQGLTASGVACCPVPGRPWLGMRLMHASGWDYLVHGVVLAAGPRPLRMCLHAAAVCGTGLRNCSAWGLADVYARPLRVVLGCWLGVCLHFLDGFMLPLQPRDDFKARCGSSVFGRHASCAPGGGAEHCRAVMQRQQVLA